MELSRISEETMDALYAIASRLYHPSRGNPCAFFVFSDMAEQETASSKLASKVLEMMFGNVHVSRLAENPKTGNMITIFTWKINHEAFKEWYSEERVRKLKKVGA